MTTKPSSIEQIKKALESVINAKEHARLVYAVGNYESAVSPSNMREVLAHIAAQDAEIARLREALEDLFDADMEHVLMGDGKDDQIEAIAKARAALTQTGAEK